MAMKAETVEAFVAEAEKELADILRRKTELEDLIKKCKALFRGDQRQQSLPLTIPNSSQPKMVKIKLKSLRSDRGKKIWEQIVDLLKEVGELSVSAMAYSFKERGWPISKTNGTKILYRALKDRENTIFIKTDRGTWNLKERVT